MPRLTTLPFIFSLSLFCATAAAQEINLPSDPEKAEELFQYSWNEWREVLDSMAHSDAHPNLLLKWFAASPEFLARDALRLASHPSVISAAAHRLAGIGGTKNREALENMRTSRAEKPEALLLWIAAIRSGSPTARRHAQRLGKNLLSTTKLKAAIPLAGAEIRSGLETLRAFVREESTVTTSACRALGRYGTNADQRLLRAAHRRNPTETGRAAAQGELELRLRFPFHHEAMLRQDAGSLATQTPDGMYDYWLSTFHLAVEHGAKTSNEFIHFFERAHKDLANVEDPDVLKRNMSTFVLFWTKTNEAIASCDPRPNWPTDLAGALLTIESTGKLTPQQTADRISAIIALCGSAGKQTQYGPRAVPQQNLSIVKADGNRATDGNPSTAMRIAEGSSFVIEHQVNAPKGTLWLMTHCPVGAGGRVEKITLESKDPSIPHSKWSKNKSLSPSRSGFQPVPTGRLQGQRLTVTVNKTKNRQVGCIAEIRLIPFI